MPSMSLSSNKPHQTPGRTAAAPPGPDRVSTCSRNSHTCHACMLLVVAAAILMASSCATRVSTAYYQPSAIDGKTVRSDKWVPHTNSIILFERQGVIIGVNNLYEPVRKEWKVQLSFEVPEGNTAQLLQHQVDISSPSKGYWKSGALTGWTWSGPGRTEEFPVDAVMVGKDDAWQWGTARGFGSTRHAAYFFSAVMYERDEAESLDRLEIRIPGFLANNSVVELPVIQLQLDVEDVWYSLP